MGRVIEVVVGGRRPEAVSGSTGLKTQMPGGCITADAYGDPGKTGNLTQVATDAGKIKK